MSRFIKINKEEIIGYFILFIQIFPLVIPMGLNHVSPILYQVIYNYWQKTALVIISILFFINLSKKRKKDFWNVFLFVLPSYGLFITLFNGGGFSTWYSAFIMPIIIFMLVDTNRHNLTRVVNLFIIILEFWLVINLFSMIKYPSGMYYNPETRYYLNWMLGYKSSLQYFILPVLCLKWMKSKYKGKMLGFYVMLVQCLAEAIIGRNSMLIVGILIFSVILIFNLFKHKIVCISSYYIIVIIANLLLIVGNEILARNNYWKALLLFFGKSSGISGRVTTIWPNTIRAIIEHPVFGNGTLTTLKRITINGGFYSGSVVKTQI